MITTRRPSWILAACWTMGLLSMVGCQTDTPSSTGGDDASGMDVSDETPGAGDDATDPARDAFDDPARDVESSEGDARPSLEDASDATLGPETSPPPDTEADGRTERSDTRGDASSPGLDADAAGKTDTVDDPDGVDYTDSSCTPARDELLCAQHNLECGSKTLDTPCGRTNVTCGTCDSFPNSTCKNNSCTCEPKTCQSIFGACGPYADGCGGTINCQSGCEDFLVTGGYHTCFQDVSKGEIQCWGWNKYGQLGTGSATPTVHNAPRKVKASFQSPTSLTAGEDMTCVVDQGDAKCWGANYHGQALGYKKNASGQEIKKVLQPTSPKVPGNGIREIDTQVQHTCALTTNQHLYCWGYNWPFWSDGGALNTSLKDAVSPTQYSFGQNKKIEKIDAGALHTCGESVRGELWCFGIDFFGGLGDGKSSGKREGYNPPRTVSGFSNGFVQVESGGMDERKGGGGASFMHDFSCAIDSSGATKCWGSDADGELGNDNNKSTQSGNSVEFAPVQVKGLAAESRDLSLGGAHACTVRNTTLYCWGDNEFGQIGDGTTQDRPTPVKVKMPGGRRVLDVEAGFYHTCVRLEGDKVACWGRNKEGQIGTGTSKQNRKKKIKTPTLVNL